MQDIHADTYISSWHITMAMQTMGVSRAPGGPFIDIMWALTYSGDLPGGRAALPLEAPSNHFPGC